MKEEIKPENLRIHSRADELIACLEGEIAKRDETIARLEPQLNRAIQANYDLREELAAIKAPEPVGWYTEDHLDDKSATTYSKELADRWGAKGWPVFPLYAAPVSEAKAQDTVGEVVGWYRLDRPYEMTSYPSVCATWHKLGAPVAPLYAAPAALSHGEQVRDALAELLECPASVVQATVPHAGIEAAPPYQVVLDVSVSLTRWKKARAALEAAAPAAPAADAGASLIEWTKDAVEWGGALNYAAWEFVNECPEKSALLFNNTKGPLRAAIMKYAEIVAANAKDSEQ